MSKLNYDNTKGGFSIIRTEYNLSATSNANIYYKRFHEARTVVGGIPVKPSNSNKKNRPNVLVKKKNRRLLKTRIVKIFGKKTLSKTLPLNKFFEWISKDLTKKYNMYVSFLFRYHEISTELNSDIDISSLNNVLNEQEKTLTPLSFYHFLTIIERYFIEKSKSNNLLKNTKIKTTKRKAIKSKITEEKKDINESKNVKFSIKKARVNIFPNSFFLKEYTVGSFKSEINNELYTNMIKYMKILSLNYSAEMFDIKSLSIDKLISASLKEIDLSTKLNFIDATTLIYELMIKEAKKE